MLTFERASELLRYEPETGKVYWKAKPSPHAHRTRIGGEAGYLLRDQWNTYRQIGIDGRIYLAHRLAWLLHFGVWPTNQIDHMDGDGLNNRPKNMRDVAHQENLKNQRMQRNNISGVTGVSWHKRDGKWRATININGKRKSLGYFDDINEAAKAYRDAAEANGYSERHTAVA